MWTRPKHLKNPWAPSEAVLQNICSADNISWLVDDNKVWIRPCSHLWYFSSDCASASTGKWMLTLDQSCFSDTGHIYATVTMGDNVWAITFSTRVNKLTSQEKYVIASNSILISETALSCNISLASMANTWEICGIIIASSVNVGKFGNYAACRILLARGCMEKDCKCEHTLKLLIFIPEKYIQNMCLYFHNK